jgi:glycosyltransferase involved in cell wall biosynthesis
LGELLRCEIGQPHRWLDIRQGKEDFHFPATWRLLDFLPNRPDILHCQNMHVGYFDLRALPWLSHQVPVVLTLHDAWLLSGHCAHSFGCERWKIGCGQCPDLTIYPAIRRDATAYNWKRKRKIFAQSRFYVATPSQWLMDKVEQSILAVAIVAARVIPYGVDLTIFHPTDRQTVRAALGIEQDIKVLLFVANSIRRNVWKDYQFMRNVVAQIGGQLAGQRVLFIALGDDGFGERIGQVEIRFVPYQKAPETVARYYQAADVYIHAAKADTFPIAIIEALACGIPVVATAVGGIPEQVKGAELANEKLCISNLNRSAPHEATGFLVPPRDEKVMIAAIKRLLTDESLRCRLGENAANDAQKRFDLERQVDEYLEWYEEICHNSTASDRLGEPCIPQI